MEDQTFGSHATTTPEGMLCPIEFPLLIPLDTWTDDNRRFQSAGFSLRDLPLSVSFMRTRALRHDGSVVAGNLDEVTVHADGRVSGKGWAVDDEVGQTMARLIKSQALTGNSVDLAGCAYEIIVEDDGTLREDYVKSKLAGTTVCPIPAFEGAFASIPDDAAQTIEPADAVMLSAVDATERTPISLSSGVKVKKELPPADHFAKPTFDGLRPLDVRADLSVSGYIAGWGSSHLSSGVAVPHSNTDYAYFLNGQVLTDGGMVPTGRLVIGGEHAPEDAIWTSAIDYYAATSRAWADVFCGEDEYGIWVAGRVRPGTSDNDVYAARASDNSGDWRPIGRDLELIVSLSVNAGAFPKPRVRAFCSEGVTKSLVGAGMLHSAAAAPSAVTAALTPEAQKTFDYIANRMAREEAAEIAAALAAEDD